MSCRKFRSMVCAIQMLRSLSPMACLLPLLQRDWGIQHRQQQVKSMLMRSILLMRWLRQLLMLCFRREKVKINDCKLSFLSLERRIQIVSGNRTHNLPWCKNLVKQLPKELTGMAGIKQLKQELRHQECQSECADLFSCRYVCVNCLNAEDYF